MNKEMKLEYMHLCDYASPAVNGKLNLLGVFESFFTTIIPDFYIVATVTVPVVSEYKISFEIQSEDGSKKIFFDNNPINIKDNPLLRFQIIKNFKNIDFKEYGLYKLILLVNDFPVGVKNIEVKKLEVQKN